MPRKAIPRAFKLICKHYRGFDRSFTAKAFVARKFHASQGVFVNQKLAAAPDCKYGKSRPLVKSYATTYPSFAAQPLAGRAVGQGARHLHSHASSLQPNLAAPSFAASPVWPRQQTLDEQATSSAAPPESLAEAPSATSPGPSARLKQDPLYSYATLSTPRLSEGEQRRRGSQKPEKTALKWYGGLDRRPLAKASGAAPPRQRSPAEHSRLASAFAAYADLDGPKH